MSASPGRIVRRYAKKLSPSLRHPRPLPFPTRGLRPVPGGWSLSRRRGPAVRVGKTLRKAISSEAMAFGLVAGPLVGSVPAAIAVSALVERARRRRTVAKGKPKRKGTFSLTPIRRPRTVAGYVKARRRL